jgi:hypothetical protein
MNSIEIVEHCFGSDVRIDGKSLEINELNENNPQEVIELRKILINELFEIFEKISNTDLRYIGEIITTISDKYEISEEESNESSCDQCGNWNYYSKFVKKDDENI